MLIFSEIHHGKGKASKKSIISDSVYDKDYLSLQVGKY